MQRLINLVHFVMTHNAFCHVVRKIVGSIHSKNKQLKVWKNSSGELQFSIFRTKEQTIRVLVDFKLTLLLLRNVTLLLFKTLKSLKEESISHYQRIKLWVTCSNVMWKRSQWILIIWILVRSWIFAIQTLNGKHISSNEVLKQGLTYCPCVDTST